MERNIQNKLGRYEKDNKYANFSLLPNNNIKYTWGISGFAPMGEHELEPDEAVQSLKVLVAIGYTLTDEIPIAEIDDIDTNGFLDWVGGITR